MTRKFQPETQCVHCEPAGRLLSMLRIGKRCVVNFPNFSQWRVRFQLLATGHAPVARIIKGGPIHCGGPIAVLNGKEKGEPHGKSC